MVIKKYYHKMNNLCEFVNYEIKKLNKIDNYACEMK